MQCFSESSLFFLLLLSRRVLAVYPLANHLTVATQLHNEAIFASFTGSINGRQFPWRCWACLFSLSFSFDFLVGNRQFQTVQHRCPCQPLFFVLSSADPIIITSQVRGDLVPDTFSIVPCPFVSTLCDSADHLSFLQDVWHATIENFST